MPTEDLARFFKSSGDLEYLEMIFNNPSSSLALAMATAEL